MFIHGNNLLQKENHKSKYLDSLSKQYLSEIRIEYDKWKTANENLTGPTKMLTDNDSRILEQRVKLFNDYKNFIDKQKYAEQFDSRSNLHSSVLEEFMYYLFRDLVESISKSALIGKSHSFKDIFFRSSNFEEMIENPNALIEIKDHDFSIGCSISAVMKCKDSDIEEKHTWDIPAVAIECKTYLDKTMLQDVSTASTQLKMKNPNAKYIVVAERLKLTENVNLKKFDIDQIYILRKQKNTDREYRYDENYQQNPIYTDVVAHLFKEVRELLTTDWNEKISNGLERGYLI